MKPRTKTPHSSRWKCIIAIDQRITYFPLNFKGRLINKFPNSKFRNLNLEMEKMKEKENEYDFTASGSASPSSASSPPNNSSNPYPILFSVPKMKPNTETSIDTKFPSSIPSALKVPTAPKNPEHSKVMEPVFGTPSVPLSFDALSSDFESDYNLINDDFESDFSLTNDNSMNPNDIDIMFF